MDPHALRVLEFPRVRSLVVERCSTPGGRRVSESVEPYNQRDTVAVALGQVDEARDLIDRGMPLPLRGIEDLRHTIDSAHDAARPLEPSQLLAILRTLRAADELRAFVHAERQRCPELAVMTDKLLSHDELIATIDRCIEPPGAIQDRASDRLWEIRRKARRIEDDARERLNALMQSSRVQRAVQSPTFSIRSGRFVLPVKLDMKGHVPGILHDHSQTGATAFIEPKEIVPLSNELRALRLEQSKEENRILWEVTRDVFNARDALVHTENILAWIDFTHAKARLSKEFELRSPELSPDGRLRMSDARHPLLLAAAVRDGADPKATVVPINVRLREGFRTLVITGPNTGGKTVTLKTIGLVQAMFQAGMHVPLAAGSCLPIFREIHADIGDEQSIDQSLSTFSGHIKNIAEILATADKRSLVLLDELGAGTDPAEGAALGQAILAELRERRATSVVTTHLGSLKNFAFANPDVENACVEFDAKSMRPIYRLLIGQPGNSNALVIAERCGLDESVLARARRNLEEAGAGENKEFIDQLMESRVALEKTREESDRRLGRAKNLQKAAEERLRHLEKKERRVKGEAEDVVDEALKRLASDADPLLRELQSVPNALKPTVERLRKLVQSAIRESSVGKKRRELIESLKKGDKVFVPRFGQECSVKKIRRSDERMTVMVGNLAMEIGFDEVSWLPRGE